MIYVGIDWADTFHQVFVTSESAQELASFSITHDIKGFKHLLSKIRSLSKEGEEVLFAIETPNHPLVEYFLDKGYTVYPINPKAVDRYRDRHRVSGSKTDLIDAMALAHLLRTDRQCHRPISPDSEEARELKILTEDLQHLTSTRTRLSNQLTACLKSYYSVPLSMFGDIDRKCALLFLKSYPTLEEAQALSFDEFKDFLKSCGYPQTQRIKKTYELLKSPQIPIRPSVVRAKSRYMLVLISQLISLITEIEAYEEEIERLLKKHPDSKTFTLLPGAGPILAARMLVELGDNRQLYPYYSSLQCIAGTAPVTKASGKYKIVKFRHSCKKNLRNTMQQFAFCSISKSSWARVYYDNQRAKGKTHNQALRALANKWLKIIYVLWQKKDTYDESHHLAMQEKHKMLLAA